MMQMQNTLSGVSSDQTIAQQTVKQATDEMERAETEYEQTLRALHSRINRLRQANWQGMQGIEFENFLAEIFLELAYQVETTKVTRDQGVDLIVSKDGRRIAIQAKGYPSSTVGNSAVQEANTGMRYYDCRDCAVITNSTFTSGARDLANKVGCYLIDRNAIPRLIEGQIRL